MDVSTIGLSVAQEFENGSRIYNLGDTGEQVGVNPDRAFYWATSGGWEWIITSGNHRVREESCSNASYSYFYLR